MTSEPTVFVVDDDDAVRNSLKVLLETEGLTVETFATGQEAIDGLTDREAGCVLLDVRLPDLNGLEVQRRLRVAESILPVIMITGHGDVTTAVQAMKGGAFDFVEKPFDDELVIARVREALNKQRRSEESVRARRLALAAIERLTPRELEVFAHLVNGRPNKIIAYELGISPRTVEIHRARVMEKLEAQSLSEVVHTAVAAGFEGGADGEA